MSRRAQRGWAGLVAILIALLVIGVLGTTAMKRYGLLPGSPALAQREEAPDARDPGGAQATTATGTPIERARGVEAMVLRGADEAAKRIDESSR